MSYFSLTEWSNEVNPLLLVFYQDWYFPKIKGLDTGYSWKRPPGLSCPTLRVLWFFSLEEQSSDLGTKMFHEGATEKPLCGLPDIQALFPFTLIKHMTDWMAVIFRIKIHFWSDVVLKWRVKLRLSVCDAGADSILFPCRIKTLIYTYLLGNLQYVCFLKIRRRMQLEPWLYW